MRNNDTIVVVPVKEPNGAKQRTADILSIEQRYELAITLMKHVFSVLKDCNDITDTLVVTDSDEVKVIAESYDTKILFEEKGEGETAAVEAATKWVKENDYKRQLVIPGDLPMLNRSDIKWILQSEMKEPYVVFCPATDDDGTNAILTAPNNILKYRFGDASFREYMEQAENKGYNIEILRRQNLVLDLDTPDDLGAFLRLNFNSPARELLESWNIPSKLEAMV